MMLGRLQAWLQGGPGPARCVWLGNLLSDVRFWLWRLGRGGRP